MSVMSSSIKDSADLLLFISIVLGVAGLWVMQWQIRNSPHYSGGIWLTPDSIKRVVRIHRKVFPHSIFRKFVGYGSLAAALAAAGIAMFFSVRNS